MKCVKCYAENQKDVVFCTSCGAKIPKGLAPPGQKWAGFIQYRPGEEDVFDLFFYSKLSVAGQKDVERRGIAVVTNQSLYLLKKEGVLRPKITVEDSFSFADFGEMSLKRSALHPGTILIPLNYKGSQATLEFLPDYGILSPGGFAVTSESVWQRIKRAVDEYKARLNQVHSVAHPIL